MTAQTPDQAIDQELGEAVDVETELAILAGHTDHLADEPPGQPWRISGAETADWALRQLRRRSERAVEVLRLYKAEREAIDAWRAEQVATLDRDVRYFQGRLADYHATILETEPRRKTIKLPAGDLTSSAGSVETEITDEAALAAWIGDHADETLIETLVEYVATVRRAPVKELYGGKVGAEPGEYPAFDQESGEVLPGVYFVRHPRSFIPKPKPTAP